MAIHVSVLLECVLDNILGKKGGTERGRGREEEKKDKKFWFTSFQINSRVVGVIRVFFSHHMILTFEMEFIGS